MKMCFVLESECVRVLFFVGIPAHRYTVHIKGGYTVDDERMHILCWNVVAG